MKREHAIEVVKTIAAHCYGNADYLDNRLEKIWIKRLLSSDYNYPRAAKAAESIVFEVVVSQSAKRMLDWETFLSYYSSAGPEKRVTSCPCCDNTRWVSYSDDGQGTAHPCPACRGKALPSGLDICDNLQCRNPKRATKITERPGHWSKFPAEAAGPRRCKNRPVLTGDGPNGESPDIKGE